MTTATAGTGDLPQRGAKRLGRSRAACPRADRWTQAGSCPTVARSCLDGRVRDRCALAASIGAVTAAGRGSIFPGKPAMGVGASGPGSPRLGSLASTGLGPTGGCSASPLGHREGIWSGRPPRQLPGGRPDFRCREQTTVSRLAACRPAPARVQTPWAVEVLVLPAAAAASRANAPPFAWSAASRKLLPGGVPDPNASAVLR
jgi:hypothetical protein